MIIPNPRNKWHLRKGKYTREIYMQANFTEK